MCLPAVSSCCLPDCSSTYCPIPAAYFLSSYNMLMISLLSSGIPTLSQRQGNDAIMVFTKTRVLRISHRVLRDLSMSAAVGYLWQPTQPDPSQPLPSLKSEVVLRRWVRVKVNDRLRLLSFQVTAIRKSNRQLEIQQWRYGKRISQWSGVGFKRRTLV